MAAFVGPRLCGFMLAVPMKVMPRRYGQKCVNVLIPRGTLHCRAEVSDRPRGREGQRERTTGRSSEESLQPQHLDPAPQTNRFVGWLRNCNSCFSSGRYRRSRIPDGNLCRHPKPSIP